MDNNIKYLVEQIQGFELSDYQNDDDTILSPEDIQAYTYSYHPKTNKELRECVKKLLVKGEKNLNIIDVSQVTDFSQIFRNQDMKDVDISEWDVSNGEKFDRMFMFTTNCNIDISEWDVSSGEDFAAMFYGSSSFNGDLSKWNVSSGVNFNNMFNGCRSFNCDLSRWKCTSGQSFNNMFCECTSFNQSFTWVLHSKEVTNMFHNCPLDVDIQSPIITTVKIQAKK